DIRELHPLEEAISRASYIIHAAAIVSYDPRHFKLMKAINIDGTANVVNIAADYSIQKIVHISSNSVFISPERDRVITEELDNMEGVQSTYYGVTKYLAEQEVWRAHYEGQNVVILNPSLIIGDGDWTQSSLQIFKRAYDGLPYYPKGGTAIVDIRDVADVTIRLLESDINGQRYIISATDISYFDLFDKMTTAMNKKPPSKPAPKWMLQILWRYERIRSILTNATPLITKESIISTANFSKYNNSKSLSIPGFSYRNFKDTIKEFSEKYVKYRLENQD
ncbi:MAG: NAD-dependent epimerase/dehydratase family protein, partial [Saprospiraceae bacterium]